MWIYEKKLEFPVNIRSKDLKMAQCLMAQYGGPSGELSAGLQYLTQRYTMPTGATKALLTDIGREAPKMFLLGATAFFDSFATV